MNKTSVAQQGKTASSLPPTQGLLQRQCACGTHTMGGGQCVDCAKKKSGLQRKLTIGASNDPLEQEADRIAHQVLATPAHSAVSGAAPRIQRYTGQASGETGTAPASVDRVLASGGRPLDPALQQDMEQRFGHDFSRVRVHSGAAAEQSAQDVNAHAYTVGHNIVFGAGQFAPGTNDGKRLLAHELTHVVQQSGPAVFHVGHSNEKRGRSPITAIGNQAVQRMLEANSENVREDITSTETARFSYSAGEEERPYETRVSGGMPQIGRALTARLQRTATWAAGTERTTWDAADRTMNAGGSFGFTPPTLNGSTILSSAAANTAIQAPTWTGRSVAAVGTGAPSSEVFFLANATNTASYQLDSLDAGPHSVGATKLAVAARVTALGMTPPTQCSGPGASTFNINGQPDNTTHSAAILAHERHHGTDHQTEFGNAIGAWNTAVDASIAARTVYSGPDPATAEANMWAGVGGTPSQIATRQHNAWITANNNYHGSPAGRAKRPFNPQADATCATSSMDHIP